MPLPEQGTPEREIAEERIFKGIIDIVSNVAVRKNNLPPKIHVLIRDEMTGALVAAFLKVQYVEDKGATNISLSSSGVLPPEETVMEAAHILLTSMPGIPMLCDKAVADEISESTLVWVEEDHYRLVGTPSGVLDIYTPYDSIKLPDSDLPQGVESTQFYTE
jgi:hypothetical protein